MGHLLLSAHYLTTVSTSAYFSITTARASALIPRSKTLATGTPLLKFFAMFTEHDTEKLKRKRSSTCFHAEATFVAAEDAATAYQAPSLIAAGAEARDVSTLSALLNLPVALLYVWLPSVIRRIGSKKRFILFLAILDTLGWLPLLAVMFFLRPASPFWLIALWVINLIPGVLLLPLRDSWLADIVPAGRIGRYLGIRTAMSALAYLGTFFYHRAGDGRFQ